jgi:hypothetical protein
MERRRGRLPLTGTGNVPGLGGRLIFVFGLLLAVSALTGWYTGEGVGTTVSVLGWHTGTIGKSLVAIAIGSVATVLVLVRLISIPEEFFFANRALGIWLSLICAVGIIVGGLLEASEEL